MNKIYILLFFAFLSSTITAQNVGIGTNDPKVKLDINGSLALREGPAITLANGGASGGTNDNIVLPDITTGVKAGFYRIVGPTAAFSVFGIVPTTGADGQLVTLVNTTNNPMAIKNNASSVAANGFKTLTGSDMVSVAGNSSITIQYNKTESRWYVTGSQNYVVTTGSIATGDITTANSAITLTNNTGRLVGTGTMTVDVQNNELNKKGLVPGPTGGNGNQVWGTDVSGNPAWQKVNNSQLNNSSITVNNGTGISVSGSPVALGGTVTVTNTAPDQTVILNNGAGISATGTYPNFTIANTGDLSATNEAQTIAGAGTSDISLSQAGGAGGGTITLQGTGATTVTRSGNTFTINSSNSGGTVTAVTASNGLNATGGATPDIKLGGTLATNTDVALNSKNLSFSGAGNVSVGTTSTPGTLSVNGTAVIGSGLVSRAAIGATISTSSATAFAANTDIGDGSRQFSIVNENATANSMATLSMRTNANGGANNQMVDVKLVNPNDGTSKLNYTFISGATPADRFAMTSAGFMGVGHATPQHQLSVGTVSSDGQGITIRGYSNSPTSWKGGGAFGYSSASVIVGELNGAAQIGGHNATLTGWANLLLNSAAGNVGVGTTAPLGKFSVGAGSLTDASLQVQMSTGGAGTESYYAVNKNGAYGLLMGYVNGTGLGTKGVIRNVSADPLSFYVNNTTEAMTILSNANVGVGMSPGN
ncbi:MAG TPA: hypothetical protein VK174_17290, partial [Chitinophagales bacterium]|nr:hypothetical protein [Chitinophagales bacterium]